MNLKFALNGNPSYDFAFSAYVTIYRVQIIPRFILFGRSTTHNRKLKDNTAISVVLDI